MLDCDNDYTDGNVKIRDHCHITGNYRGFAHRDCNINGKLNHKMSFSINNKLSFIDSFQFLSSSLDSLVKNLNKHDFKYLSQKFDNNFLDVVKRKWFYLYEYMSDFEKFKVQLPRKEKF